MDNVTTFMTALTALIVALGAFISAVMKTKKEIENTIPKKVKNQSNINKDIIEHMENLKEFLGADRVQIYDFHNGEHYANGRSALKVSCTYEVVRVGVRPCQTELQSIPISCIPKFINELLNNQVLDIQTLEEIKNDMPGTYNLKKSQGIKSFYDVVLNNKNREPIGFLGIQYVNMPHKEYSTDFKNEVLKLKFYIEDSLEKMITLSKKEKGGKKE